MFVSNLFKSGRYLLIAGALLLFYSCSEEEEDQAPQQEPVLESVVSIEKVTLQEILDFLIEDYNVSPEELAQFDDKLQFLRSVAVDLTAYSVKYHTVTPDGQPIVASGMVYYPDIKNPRGVVEVSPINRGKTDCATRCIRTIETISGTLGYVSVLPDLIGCGSTEELPISYMQHENAARVSADLRRAADELIREKYNRSISNKSILFGYSLGGSVSWALARYYAKHPELGVDVKDVYIGGGAYDPSIAMKAFASTRYSQYAILPNILYSMNNYDKLSLDFNKIFRGELLKNYREWCTGQVPIAELTRRLGYDIGEYINLEFLSEDNPAMQRVMQAVATKAIPNDWVPSGKVHMYCSKNDTYVPRQCSDQLYDYLKSVGAKVDYTLLEEDHVKAGLTMGLLVMERVLFSTNP